MTSVATPSAARRPTPQWLLERYVQAKDLTQPRLMQEIYTRDAVLTYSIATDAISFPSRAVGLEQITDTLVVGFATRFSRCKTYYVCESAPRQDANTVLVPWLVLMRENHTRCLRAGKGCYHWSFQRQTDGTVRVFAMHIHIERMEPVEDEGGELLRIAQSDLPYPWLPEAVLRVRFESLIAADARFAFLEELRTPLSPVECRRRLADSIQAI